MGKLIYIYERLKEPSSHTSILLLLSYVHVSEAQFNDWMGIATLFVGMAAVFTPEAKPAQKIDGFSK